MDGKTMKYGRLLIAIFLILMMGGCSVFVSTPRVTSIQIQGVDDQLWEYIVTLDDPTENGLGIRLSERYSLQFDFEWLWNTESDAAIYSDFNDEYGDPTMAPWMLCKYRF